MTADPAAVEFESRVDATLQTPAWRGYAEAAEAHPPLRGLLAVPIVGEDGLNSGLPQLSDKADGTDFVHIESV